MNLNLRGVKYKVTSDLSDYDLEVSEVNNLFLKRDIDTYMTIDLDKMCLGAVKRVLLGVGIEIEKEAK